MNNASETGKNIWTQLVFEESGIHGLFIQSGKFVIKFLKNPFGPITATQMTAVALSSNFVKNDGQQKEEFSLQWAVVLAGVLHTIVDITNTFCWISADFFITFWSLHFRKTFDAILVQEVESSTGKIQLKVKM